MKILVVGGNGFIGSAVCKAALSRGFQVTSVSSSGRPYRTPKGHSPAWTSKVTWLRGDALQPSSFSHILDQVDGVVHTLGTLLEGAAYKQPLKDGNSLALLGSLVSRFASPNPLKQGTEGSYELVNRDSALRVCEAFVTSGQGQTYPSPRPFVYISAEDVFRPLIPARYIQTKRQAEVGIESIISARNSLNKTNTYRGVYVRPGLVYHAHFRPLTTPAAVLLDLSATMHSRAPRGIPTPSNVLRTLSSAFRTSSMASPDEDLVLRSSSLESIANALTIPPIHVDHVAEAICFALDSDNSIQGVVDVGRMREITGWPHPRVDAEPTSQSHPGT